jgi:MYXO-CTERM domain-containing protein
LVVAAISILASVGSALGDISQDVFVIRAENANGVAEYRATFFDGYFNPDGSYEWTLPQAIMMTNPQGVPIAMLQSASVMCHDDPDVSLNFNVLAGSIMTTFTISSATVSFATLAQAEGRSSATIALTDLTSDSATLSPANGQAGAYTSRYNGAAPGGTIFHDSFTSPVVEAVPGGSTTATDDFPGGGLFSPISGPVSDISSRFAFTLSAGDLASGTSIFRVQAVPTPGALALLGLGALAAGRRRGR